MEFSTKVKIAQAGFNISHRHKILMMGSCFTENVGQYLKQYRFQTILNPFGIIYNPLSLFNNLERIAEGRYYEEDELLYYNELYLSLDHHGSFSDTGKSTALENINREFEQAAAHFKDTEWILITPGTAFVYNYLALDRIAANCHKIPAKEFEKRLLTIDEIMDAFNAIREKLGNKKILFTVSPVRHWRDGAVENQRSKSILIESIHRIIEKNDHCFYFPAYEIMMDELRDYRFYSEDMLHPNELAVKYIWERFGETYFSAETQVINQKIEKINLLRQHRVKHVNTKEATAFKEHLDKTKEEFRREFPWMVL